MKLHTGKDFEPVRVASTLVKSFAVYGDGKLLSRVDHNIHRLVTVPVGSRVKELTVCWEATHGAEQVRLFSADLPPATH